MYINIMPRRNIDYFTANRYMFGPHHGGSEIHFDTPANDFNFSKPIKPIKIVLGNFTLEYTNTPDKLNISKNGNTLFSLE